MFEFERAVSTKALWEAWQKIKSKGGTVACGVDQMDVGSYAHEAYDNIIILNYSLLSGAYQPYSEKMFVSKKNRKIYISCIEDKIVQTSVAKVLSEIVTFHPSVHSFIKGRSIFTAYSALKKYLSLGDEEFYKLDIQKFYESISKIKLMKKIEELTGDKRFLELIEKLLMNHPSGLSTGSCLSPILSNLYMKDFDLIMSERSDFYLRYVDDMLIAPKDTMQHIVNDAREGLKGNGLWINEEKSKIVRASEGFKYLGFDVKKHKDVDKLIQQGNFAGLQTMLNGCVEQESEMVQSDSKSVDSDPINKKADQINNEALTPEQDRQKTRSKNEEEKTTIEVPKYILAIEKNCHIVRYLIDKAKAECFLSHPEKRVLLYLYRCLKEEGQKYLHNILRHCIDYDYQITQGYIDRCKIQQPMGCKKIAELFEDICDKSLCNCNFKSEKIYPTPLIHAIRQEKNCFDFSYKKESVGHFKKLPPKADIHETLIKMLALNKQRYDIKTQQAICKNHLESLFEKNGYQEVETPQGLLIRNEKGFFIKI